MNLNNDDIFILTHGSIRDCYDCGCFISDASVLGVFYSLEGLKIFLTKMIGKNHDALQLIVWNIKDNSEIGSYNILFDIEKFLENTEEWLDDLK